MTLFGLALSTWGCSSEAAQSDEERDAGGSEISEEAGEGEAGPEAFVEVVPEGDGDCSEPSGGGQPGHDFCPGAVCSCSTKGLDLEVFAQASDFGEGVRFVSMQGDIVLAESAEKEPLLYFIDYQFNGAEPSVDVVPVPFEPPLPKAMRGRGITGDALTRAGYALLCDEESCLIYAVEDRESGPVAKALSASIPFTPSSIVGLFVQRGGDERHLCLFGDGIHCLHEDGSFEAVLPGGGGKLLAVDPPGRWLVGENGRVVRLRGNEAAEPYFGVSARLHSVKSTDFEEAAWAAGDDGTLLAFGDAGPRICKKNGYDFVGALSYGGVTAWIDRAGTILLSPDPRRHRIQWCAMTLMDDVLAVEYRGCGIADNLWLLSAEELRGGLRCVID